MKHANDIKQLVARNRLEQAIPQLLSMAKEVDNPTYNIAIVIASEVHALEEAKLLGSFSLNEWIVARRQLTERILQLTDRIDGNF
ncbi:MAG: hypothetical protein AAFV95_01885 [Bacteroidota bacterium]